MNIDISTERLHIRTIRISDAVFMVSLLNSPGWLTYIGDKKIRTISDCEKYVESVIAYEENIYSVVYLHDQTPIGVITLVKKDYLPEHDLGFAFLGEYQGKGYAQEASRAVLECEWVKSMPFVSAVVLQQNNQSIALLERLGFVFTENLHRENEDLLWYRWQNHTFI
jgi:[ribosomal protein S5]-alanine N-acetyltransferase